MVQTKIFCDRCSERITSDRTCYRARCGPHRLRRPEFDLCDPCHADFETFLASAPAPASPALAGAAR